MKKLIEKRVKAILFDLDGVLIDSFHFWFYLFNDTLKHFGHNRISLKTFRRHWGKSTQEDIENFMPERKIKEIRSYFFSNMHKFTKYIKVNKEARPVLEILKSKYKLGCVSNSHKKILRWQIHKSGLKKYFQVIVSADDVERPKPAPDMLLKALKKLKVQPDETIFVGDTKTDLIAGEKAGCIVVGYNIKSKLKTHSLRQIFVILRNFKKRSKNAF